MYAQHFICYNVCLFFVFQRSKEEEEGARVGLEQQPSNFLGAAKQCRFEGSTSEIYEVNKALNLN